MIPKPFAALLALALAPAGCLDSDPQAQKRAEEERRYLESRLEEMEQELRDGLASLPADRILDLAGPELRARASRAVEESVRRSLREELRAELALELDLRCEERCEAAILEARRRDRSEVEAGRDRALEELRRLREEVLQDRRGLQEEHQALEEARAVMEAGGGGGPVSCSAEGDAAFQKGLMGDALGIYKAALKKGGPPECYRVIAVIYGVLGYRKTMAEQLTNYLHVVRSRLQPQQIAVLQAEIRALNR